MSDPALKTDAGQLDRLPPVYVCRCEEITAAEINAAIAGGVITLSDVKRRTRAGMGVCQGVYCLSEVGRLIQEKTGQSPEEIWPMTMRPPARQITLGALVGAVDGDPEHGGKTSGLKSGRKETE